MMLDRYLRLLELMVNIDSGTGDNDGIGQIATVLQSELSELRFEVQTCVAGDGSHHYFAGRGQGERVLILAHLDTVFPRGTAAARPFSIDGKLARGPGVSDCKSGLVTLIAAMEHLTSTAWPGFRVECLFNSDEEIGSPGSRALIEKMARGARVVLVLEPAEGSNLTVARKGVGRFTMRVFGKAAHSGSNYSDGRSAIWEMAHKIMAIQNLTDPESGISLNVGVVSGGVRPNIVPDYAAAEIDLRFVQPKQEGQVRRQLEKIAAQATIPGTITRLNGEITRPVMPVTEANLKLYHIFQEIGSSLGLELGQFHSGGGSDANFTAALGIPTLDGLGPIGGGHHSEEEHLFLPSLPQRIDLLTEFLKRLPDLDLPATEPHVSAPSGPAKRRQSSG